MKIEQIKQITIVGGGTAGWMTAAILAKGLADKPEINITVIESPEVSTVGVGEASIPPLTQLTKYLEWDEAELMRATDATFKYGIKFDGWGDRDSSYMHAFGRTGAPYFDHMFSSMWLAFRTVLDLPPLIQFSPTASAALLTRFSYANDSALADPQHANSETLSYAYQFDASLLAEMLAKDAKSRGVKHISGHVTHVKVSANNHIEQLTLSSLQVLAADLFVDCSGARGLLNKQALNAKFIDWQTFLPCDRAIAVQTESSEPPVPYTQSVAMNAGWRWRIPLQSRIGNGYVYSSRHLTDQEAWRELQQSLGDSKLITEPKFIKFNTGCIEQPWQANSVAIGLSCGFFEPLESTSIHMIHKYALELKNALVYGKTINLEQQRFNDNYHFDALTILDFLLLHYVTTSRNDADFWRDCQILPQPDTLTFALKQYKETGFIGIPQGALFPFESWFQVLVGQGVFPDESTLRIPLVDGNKVMVGDAKSFFTQITANIENESKKMPSHGSVLANL